MTNLIYILSNRRGPFVTPEFIKNDNFVPATYSPEMEQLRALFYLDVTSNDFYLKSYLNLISSYPELCDLVEREPIVRPWDWQARGMRITGAEVISNGRSGVFTDPIPNKLPINFNYRIDYVGANQVKITSLETGTVTNVPVKYHAGMLNVEWPSDVPFDTTLRLTQPWSAGAEINIRVEPSSFPYRLLYRKIYGNPALSKLLVKHKLIEEFVSTPDIPEKVALALVAMIYEYPAQSKN